jgi:DNA invertase Pin-like site-specific DNA recombinase
MSIYNLDRGTIRPEHRERAAYVYVRQSSPTQVREHQESRRRQYAFAEQARALGWSDAQVVTLDDDQGRSGTIPKTRAGFGQLVAAVARGEVGIVMSLELSRLSRNDPDWHHLVHLCRWTGTLIADEHGLYDPTSGPDRMLLGIRGHVSELERTTPCTAWWRPGGTRRGAGRCSRSCPPATRWTRRRTWDSPATKP